MDFSYPQNLCVKLYFAKFHPLFPIIHSASFRPTSDRALVLLSVCSIGALFVGSDGAAKCGKAIFTKLNKAILASWEHYIHQGGREALSVAQAATLGQTYGILSGQPNDLLLTESFHGTVIAWARLAGIFNVRKSLRQDVHVDMCDIEGSWKRWAQREETLRLVLALQVHDSEFAKIFHHEGLLRHDQHALPACCPAKLFAATSACRWHALVTSTAQTGSRYESIAPAMSPLSDAAYNDPFYAYAQLAGHFAQLSEARCSGLCEDQAIAIRQRLTLWYEDIAGSGVIEPNADPLSLIALWHQSFMALYVDLDLLERVIGRDGAPPTTSEESEMRRWVHSDDAIRCALHATLIIKRQGSQVISAESAIHAPLGLFHAGVVVYCFIKFAGLPMRGTVEVVELKHREISSTDVMAQMDRGTLYSVTDILQRHGHWGLSRRLASILEVLMEDSTNAEMR